MYSSFDVSLQLVNFMLSQESTDTSLATTNGKKLYAYQQKSIEEIFEKLKDHPKRFNLLYQLPTGGGKTVIFSELTKRYIQRTGKKVLILTHRIELCSQTDKMLREFGVNSMIINSAMKELPVPNDYLCYVAMVETLNNRLRDKILDLDNIGLMIVDEAHHNSFGKLFKFYEKGVVLGVTATPLSSNNRIPMKDTYDELIVGESISSLVEKGFLAKATTYHYHVGLTSLKVGRSGDYTVSSSERLYNNHAMQDKLLHAYREKCLGKKTLIFNNGIATSQYVFASFKEAGYPIRHLDHTYSAGERKEILKWFHDTPDAVLTSVSILTTGFDEPTVECIILNRATKSLTLYFQMIGRGSRILENKKEFSVIDLGNNMNRFGIWEDPVNWGTVFETPELYLDKIPDDEQIEANYKYEMPEELCSLFSKTKEIYFDVAAKHREAIQQHKRPKVVIEESILQHTNMCIENSDSVEGAFQLADLLKDEIEFRVRVYTRCLSKTSESYIKWLQDDYKRMLRVAIIRRSHG